LLTLKLANGIKGVSEALRRQIVYNVNNKTSKIGRDDIRVVSAFNGWHDALTGRPLNSYYSDNPSTAIAVTYMNWRLRATEVKRLRGKIPAWRTTRQVPHQVYNAFMECAITEQTRGNLRALPIGRMADEPTLKFR
jgi:hypothetical protein